MKNGERILILMVLGIALVHLFSLYKTSSLALSYPYEHRDYGEWDICHLTYLISKGDNPYPRGSYDAATAVPYTFLYHLPLIPLIRHFGPVLWIGRLFSLICLLLLLFLLYRFLRDRYGLPPRWALLGPLLGLLAQSMTGQSLVKYHPNACFLLLGMGALFAAPAGGTSVKKWWPAFLLALASFLTKQPGIIFFIGISAAAFMAHGRRALFPASLTACLGLSLVVLVDHLSGNGFYFYCFKMPAAYPFLPAQFDNTLRFFGSTAFFFMLPLLLLSRKSAYLKDAAVISALAGILLSIYSFTHEGGTLAGFVYALFPLSVVAPRLWYAYGCSLTEPAMALARPLFLTLLLFQSWAALTPWPEVADSDKGAMEHIRELIRETPEEVLALTNGHLAFLEGKPFRTSGDCMNHLSRLGLARFPQMEDKADHAAYGLVIIPELFYESPPPGAASLVALLRNNYTVSERILSVHYTHPALILRRKTAVFPG